MERESEDGNGEGSPNDGADGLSGADGPPQKRPKKPNKKCPEEGCEKSYSRAEHL